MRSAKVKGKTLSDPPVCACLCVSERRQVGKPVIRVEKTAKAKKYLLTGK
jgi:hypothetical protein